MLESSKILEEMDKLRHRLDELTASMTRQLVQETVPEESLDLFVFRVRDERMGLPVDSIEEVLPMCKLASFPEAPPWIQGLLNLRGSMIPVIDVLARINRLKRNPELGDFIVICTSNGRRFGLVVQQVFHIYKADGTLIQKVAHELPQAPYVLGLFQLEGHAVFLLSLSCLLATSDVPEDVW